LNKNWRWNVTWKREKLNTLVSGEALTNPKIIFWASVDNISGYEHLVIDLESNLLPEKNKGEENSAIRN